MNRTEVSRVKTLRRRLGKAADIIKSDTYLPMFRNRQIKYPTEFEESVRQAMRKKNPERWLAKVWACANIVSSLKMLGKYLAKAKSMAAETAARLKGSLAGAKINHAGLERLAKIKQAAKSTAGNLLL